MGNNKQHVTDKYVTGKGELVGFIALTKPSTKFNKEGVYTVSSSEIICVEAYMRKVIVHTTQKEFISIQNIVFLIVRKPHQSQYQALYEL